MSLNTGVGTYNNLIKCLPLYRNAKPRLVRQRIDRLWSLTIASVTWIEIDISVYVKLKGDRKNPNTNMFWIIVYLKKMYTSNTNVQNIYFLSHGFTLMTANFNLIARGIPMMPARVFLIVNLLIIGPNTQVSYTIAFL